MLTDVKLFNFYRRYIWNEDDFEAFQDTLIGYPAALFAALAGDAVLSGFNQNGSAGLNVSYLAGVAVNSLGNLLAANAGSVAVANNVKSLIVARPVNAQTNPITRPTAPFDTVDLNSEQTCSVVAITGTGSYPAKAAGDVILFGVTAAAGSVTDIDQSQCELIGKSVELNSLNRFNILVGNFRNCHYRTLAAALAVVVSGDRVRVRSNESVSSTIVCSVNDVYIEFDPGVTFSKGTSATGFTLSGNGIRFINGRVTGFSVAGNKGINITGDYSTVMGTRFANNNTDVNDVNGTSQQVGVISE